MSLSKDVANHKHLLFTAFAERRTRLVALAWILAQKTQLSRGFTCYKDRYFGHPTRAWDTWAYLNNIAKDRRGVYSMDTDRALSILSLITNYFRVSYHERLTVPFYKSEVNLLPWLIDSKIRWFLTSNSVSSIFTKEALNPDYRMFRTYTQVHQSFRTEGFSRGVKKWVEEQGGRRNRVQYNSVDDWKVGLRNGEIIAGVVPHHRWRAPGNRPGDPGVQSDDNYNNYTAMPGSGSYYSDESPTETIDEYDEYGVFVRREFNTGRGHKGDSIRPWWNRALEPFYQMVGNEIIWGAGPDPLIWKEVYKEAFVPKTTSYGIKAQKAHAGIGMNTPHTELSYRKAAGYNAICLAWWPESFDNPRIIETCRTRKRLYGHSLRCGVKCLKCIENTIKTVGLEESKNYRTECIYTYTHEIRDKIYTTTPTTVHYNIHPLYIPPLKKSAKQRITFKRRNTRKQESRSNYSGKVNRRIEKTRK